MYCDLRPHAEARKSVEDLDLSFQRVWGGKKGTWCKILGGDSGLKVERGKKREQSPTVKRRRKRNEAWVFKPLFSALPQAKVAGEREGEKADAPFGLPTS